jgi:hypothetical protein
MFCSALQYALILSLLCCLQHLSAATPAPGYSTDLKIRVNEISTTGKRIETLVYTSVGAPWSVRALDIWLTTTIGC